LGKKASQRRAAGIWASTPRKKDARDVGVVGVVAVEVGKV
jgi:hypothetical protein